MPADLYDVLGTTSDASAEELKRAYRERVRKYHPDVNDHPDGDAQFALIRTAHDVLSDPTERKDYDRMGHREYVEKRLDDLPPVSVFPDDALPDGAATGESTSDDAADRTAEPSPSTPSSTAASSNTSGATVGSDTDATASTDTSTATGSERPGETASAGSSGTDAEADESTADAERSAWDDAASSTASSTEGSSTPAGVRRRRGLRRWYGVVALALVAYLAGVGLYAAPHIDALRGVASRAVSTPLATLTGTLPLPSPAGYVVGAVRAAANGGVDAGLLLLAGTALLPLVVLTTVWRFGRGAAWAYALPSLAPAACLAAWSSVAVPAWLALLGLVLLPLVSGLGFLVDVGRYLAATR